MLASIVLLFKFQLVRFFQKLNRQPEGVRELNSERSFVNLLSRRFCATETSLSQLNIMHRGYSHNLPDVFDDNPCIREFASEAVPAWFDRQDNANIYRTNTVLDIGVQIDRYV